MKGFSRLFFILILFSILVLAPGCTLLWLINNDENVLFYTVTFETNGGSQIESQKVEEKTSATCPANPSKRGYIFAGWYLDTTFLSPFDFSSLIYHDTTLYAKWVKNTYTVSFDSNGGTGTMDSMDFTYDTAQNLTANSFTRDGYNFAGWNTQADGNGTSYDDVASVKNLTTTNGDTVTLYAQWTPAP